MKRTSASQGTAITQGWGLDQVLDSEQAEWRPQEKNRFWHRLPCDMEVKSWPMETWLSRRQVISLDQRVPVDHSSRPPGIGKGRQELLQACTSPVQRRGWRKWSQSTLERWGRFASGWHSHFHWVTKSLSDWQIGAHSQQHRGTQRRDASSGGQHHRQNATSETCCSAWRKWHATFRSRFAINFNEVWGHYSAQLDDALSARQIGHYYRSSAHNQAGGWAFDGPWLQYLDANQF